MIGELAALGAALSWAIAPILYRKALQTTKPLSANIVRCTTNAAVLLVILLLAGKVGVLAVLPSSVLLTSVVSGLIGLGIGDTLYLFGLKALGVSRAVPLVATYPLFSLVWAVFFLGQPLSATAVLGTAVILVGIVLLTRQKTQETAFARGRAAWLGVALCLGTAFAWSIGVTLMDVAVSTSTVTSLDANYAIVTLRLATMALVMLAFAPFIDRDRGFLKMNKEAVLLLCVGGLIANGLGWLFMNYSFLLISEAQAVPISSTSPLFAALVGFVLFHEKVTAKTIFGAVAIVVGIVLIFIV
jgi:drug/metabolite transporter (DMT)-like permease